MLHYSYLKLEKKDLKEMSLKVEKEIREYIGRNYPTQYKAVYSSMKNSNNEHEAIEEISIPTKTAHNKEMKKIYRLIAEKTHPDKTGNNNQSDFFSAATEAYNSDDIGALLEILVQLNIDPPELSDQLVDILQKNIDSFNQEIIKTKDSVAWAWFHASSDQERENLLDHIFLANGVKR